MPVAPCTRFITSLVMNSRLCGGFITGLVTNLRVAIGERLIEEPEVTRDTQYGDNPSILYTEALS